jgi:hypothetical protein
MKKLPREFVRREDKPEHSKEIWQPSWRCFCCHDTGEVNPNLAKLVIDGYRAGQDKIPRCQNLGCTAGEYLDSPSFSGAVDYRFTPEICQELDAIHREDWKKTTQTQAALIAQKVALIARAKSLRKCDHIPSEQMDGSPKDIPIASSWRLETRNNPEGSLLASKEYCPL